MTADTAKTTADGGPYRIVCGEDIVRGDELCWTEQVWTRPWQAPRLVGERTIEARVGSLYVVGARSDDRLALWVTSSSGVEDEHRVGGVIGRVTGVLAKSGVRRNEWADEARRENLEKRQGVSYR